VKIQHKFIQDQEKVVKLRVIEKKSHTYVACPCHRMLANMMSVATGGECAYY